VILIGRTFQLIYANLIPKKDNTKKIMDLILKPLISVITPTFNRQKMLKVAIESVISQTYKNWELIIIDNFSTDSTISMINKIRDQRIKLFKKKRNGSIAFSRNFGAQKSSGQWLSFLDSDDWWEDNKLEKVFLKTNSETAVIYHSLKVENVIEKKDGYLLGRRLKSNTYRDLLLNGNAIGLSSATVNKMVYDKVGGMNEAKELFGLEDYDLWLRIAKLGSKFEFINSQLGYYRKHQDNAGSSNSYSKISNALNLHLRELNCLDLARFQSFYKYQQLLECYKLDSFVTGKPLILFCIVNGKLSIKFKSIMLYFLFLFRIRVSFLKI
jgi:glycosyltransferase involved in cell wall biosynthesis